LTELSVGEIAILTGNALVVEELFLDLDRHGLQKRKRSDYRPVALLAGLA
jgi:hypothetical protein